MPPRNAVAYSERCARCDSARKVEGSAYCLSCRRIAERSIAVPGRDVAAQPTSEGRGSSVTAADEHSPSTARGRGIETHPRPSEHVHDWKNAKAIGYEDDAICFGCGAWYSDEERKELTRCRFCGQSNFAHLSDCEGRIEDMDATSEYADSEVDL